MAISASCCQKLSWFSVCNKFKFRNVLLIASDLYMTNLDTYRLVVWLRFNSSFSTRDILDCKFYYSAG